MNRKTVWTGVLVGSTVGSLVPALWGAGLFSFSAMLFSAAGAFAGIWVVYKLAGY